MANKHAEAFPVTKEDDLGGLSKREYAAIHILAGLVNKHLSEGSMRDIAGAHRLATVELAVELADMLMDEL